MAQVLQEMNATLDALEKSHCIEFYLVSHQPLIYVHVFTNKEMSANSEVSIAVWDKFAQYLSSLQCHLPKAAILSIDFCPLIMDNFGLLEEGLTSIE